MIAQIPTLSDGTQHYEQRVRLDGADYFFAFVWRVRRGLWELDVLASDRSAVQRGQAITLGVPLLSRAVEGPPGEVFALAASADPTASAPGLFELGGRVKLWYFSAEEFA